MFRHNSLKFIFLLFLSVLVFLASPAFALKDLAGKPQSLQTLIQANQWTVIKIWSKDCHICQQTMHLTERFHQQFKGAAVFGLSIDDWAELQAIKSFIAEQQLTFDNYIIHTDELNNYLQKAANRSLAGTPSYLIYNKQGELTAIQTGAVTDKELQQYIEQQEASGR